jgi:hypothetical protein
MGPEKRRSVLDAELEEEMYTYSNAPRSTHTIWITPQKERARQTYQRYNWNQMRVEAAEGKMPDPPDGFDMARTRLLARILTIAETGDAKKILAIKVGDYNSALRVISKYRDILAIALCARSKKQEEANAAENHIP